MDRTEKAIVDAFWQALDEKPFNKITVKNIVELCGVNRNTFYYHFRDIPQVMEYALKNEADNLINASFKPANHIDCLKHIITFIQTRQRAILHLYNSMQREVFIKQLNDMSFYTTKRYVQNTPEIAELPDDEKELIIYYFKCTFVGVMLDWLDSGMEYDLLSRTQKMHNIINQSDKVHLLLADTKNNSVNK